MVIKNEEHKDEILRMYAEHGNGGKIAKDLGITNYRVYKCLRQNGIEPKKVGGKQKATVERMIQLYDGGLSVTQVANRLNMNPSSIVERLQNANYKMRSRQEALELCGHTKITRNREQECIDLYQSGLSAMKVARHFGLKSKDPVLSILKKHNIQVRDMYGSNNHAWKGGRLKLNKLIRNSATYIEFRDRIMRERKYTCEITGEFNCTLNVHHIKPFCELIDQFVILYGDDIDDDDRREELYKAIDEFELFWDEDNVLVVSELVHKAIHSNPSHYTYLKVGRNEYLNSKFVDDYK